MLLSCLSGFFGVSLLLIPRESKALRSFLSIIQISSLEYTHTALRLIHLSMAPAPHQDHWELTNLPQNTQSAIFIAQFVQKFHQKMISYAAQFFFHCQTICPKFWDTLSSHALALLQNNHSFCNHAGE